MIAGCAGYHQDGAKLLQILILEFILLPNTDTDHAESHAYSLQF